MVPQQHIDHIFSTAYSCGLKSIGDSREGSSVRLKSLVVFIASEKMVHYTFMTQYLNKYWQSDLHTVTVRGFAPSILSQFLLCIYLFFSDS